MCCVCCALAWVRAPARVPALAPVRAPARVRARARVRVRAQAQAQARVRAPALEQRPRLAFLQLQALVSHLPMQLQLTMPCPPGVTI